MFDNLKKAFSDVSKGFSEKELKDKDIEDVLFELEINLLESDVATEVIESIKNSLKEKLIGTKVEKNEIADFIKNSLIQYIDETFSSAGSIDLISNIHSKKESGEPYIVVFVGINGTGKTPTLAKIASMLKNSKFSLVIAAADTYRAGAIEQIREHANRLNLKLIAQNYGSDQGNFSRDPLGKKGQSPSRPEKPSDGNKVSTFEIANIKKSLQKLVNKKQVLKEEDEKGLLSEKNIKPQK